MHQTKQRERERERGYERDPRELLASPTVERFSEVAKKTPSLFLKKKLCKFRKKNAERFHFCSLIVLPSPKFGCLLLARAMVRVLPMTVAAASSLHLASVAAVRSVSSGRLPFAGSGFRRASLLSIGASKILNCFSKLSFVAFMQSIGRMKIQFSFVCSSKIKPQFKCSDIYVNLYSFTTRELFWEKS
jgi:hypothetical protein